MVQFECAWWGCPDNGILQVGNLWFCREHAKMARKPGGAQPKPKRGGEPRRGEADGKAENAR